MNSIELFKQNAPELLDKVYKGASTTSDFDIDGALVGGASLKAEDFNAIIENTMKVAVSK